VTVASGGSTTAGGLYVPQTREQFQYDADGNLKTDGRWTYTWDAENRLTAMSVNTGMGPLYQLTFTYDAKGRRIQKSMTTNNATFVTQNFIYDGWNPIAILNPQSSILESFVWGSDLSGQTGSALNGAGGVGGLLEVSYRGTVTTNCFPAFDGNGNVAALVNAADGTVVANYEYGPFGEVIRQTGPMAKTNPVRFSTKYQDDESDLIYYGWRYYNATTGRWHCRDPLSELGGRNLYGFIFNDPVNKFDKDGRLVVVDDAAILAAVGAMLACAAAEEYIQSPAGQESIRDIANAANSIADAIAEGIEEAMKRCKRCLRRNKECLPCNPGVGSIAYRVDLPPSPPHNGVETPHSHMHVLVQRAATSLVEPCICEWIQIPMDPIPGILTPNPLPPVSGGGFAP
jgi:RHS repeat-associated protein